MKTHWNITTELGVNFFVKISKNVFNHNNRDLLELGEGNRRLVAIDSEVFFHRSEEIKSYFDHHGIIPKLVCVEISEEKKNLDNLLFILETIEDFAILRRNEPIIAIGGGVLLDMVGMAASLYRRGVPYIKVPTTLLSLVDASVGAKTSINHFGRRNRLGTYYPPLASYLDKTMFSTLPKDEFVSGMGEILKMAVIKNSDLFEILESSSEQVMSERFLVDGKADSIISMSIDGMVSELETNLWERDLKRVVDFGHSFSPLLEMQSLDDSSVRKLSHGEAVALDVIFSSCLSCCRGMLDLKSLKRIVDVSRAMKLPVYHEYFTDYLLLWESLLDTIKHRNGNQYLPVPVSIGTSTFLNDVTLEDVKVTIQIYEENVL